MKRPNNFRRKTSYRRRVPVEARHRFQLDANLKAVITETRKPIYRGGQEFGELYDLKYDPCKKINLWDDPARAGRGATPIRELSGELATSENALPRPPSVS